MLKTAPSFIFLFSFFAPALVHASACCGGGFAAPALILGENRAQLTGSVGNSQVAEDVTSDGVWHSRDDRETMTTYRLAGATLLSDRWQVGGSLPLISRAREDHSSTGLGDANANLGYEYLTDWDYSPWKPKGLGFLQVTLPTGKSIYSSEDDFQLSARGRGLWSVGAGTYLVKTFNIWDAFISLGAHHSFARQIRSSQISGRLVPGWGYDSSLGVGYNTVDWRFGAALDWSYEDGIRIEGSTPITASTQKLATAELSASYMLSNEWASTLTYSDQTWFGSPSNTSLTRGLMLVVQRRWLR